MTELASDALALRALTLQAIHAGQPHTLASDCGLALMVRDAVDTCADVPPVPPPGTRNRTNLIALGRKRLGSLLWAASVLNDVQDRLDGYAPSRALDGAANALSGVGPRLASALKDWGVDEPPATASQIRDCVNRWPWGEQC